MPLPSDIANLALWFRAYDLVNFADGTAINGNWSSVAGTCTATQATGANQPTKQTVNGQQVVRCDGINDSLALGGDALTFTQNATGVTVFAKLKVPSAPSTTIGGVFGVSINGATGARMLMRINGNTWNFGGRRADADSFLHVGSTPIEYSRIHVLSGVLDAVNTDAFLYLDRLQVGVNTTWQSTGNFANTASLTAFLGCAPDSTNFIPMDLYEIVAYSRALSDNERQQVEDYLLPPSAWRAEARCNIRVI